MILIGEIRDLETAEIAIQASLTGHLVFSTLHTNDAPSAITRLVDMGVEPFLVASSLVAVLAQRLVRVLCKDCRVAYEATPEELAEIGIKTGERKVQVYRPEGCAGCNYTGYRGRVGIFELMQIDDDIRALGVAEHRLEVDQEQGGPQGHAPPAQRRRAQGARGDHVGRRGAAGDRGRGGRRPDLRSARCRSTHTRASPRPAGTPAGTSTPRASRARARGCAATASS